MNSFRHYLIEQADQQQWFESMPMPQMVGNALMVSGQYANNFKQQGMNESYGDVHKGRGFPMSKAATNLLSIVPLTSKASTTGTGKEKQSTVGETKNIGPMIYAFDWLVNRGLFEALQVRKKLAQEATQALMQSMGEAAFREKVRGDAITEDMVYSKKAHAEIPELGKWVSNLDPQALEPQSMIKIPVGGSYQRISLDDINNVIDMLNGEQKLVELSKFSYGGTDGFIEWIEDGPWAEKIGTVDKNQPWRTRNGISLHDAKVAKDPETGQLAYQFGGIISPLRSLDGSYQKKMRSYIQGIISDTARAVKNQVDTSNLTPEEEKWLNQIKGIYGGTNVLQFNFGSFSASRGYSQSDAPEFSPDQAADYAAHVLMLRAAIDMRAAINDALDQGADPEAIMKKYNINKNDLKKIRGKEKNRINSANKDQFYRAFNISKGVDHWKTGKAKITSGAGDLRSSSVLNIGFSYLKHLLDQGESLPMIINQYLGDEIKDGTLGDFSIQELIREIQNIVSQAGSSEVPKLGLGEKGDKPVDLKTNFGSVVKDKQIINSDQIADLIDKGYQFQPDYGEPNDTESAKNGRLVKGDKLIVLRRKDVSDPWTALYVDDDPGKRGTKYSTDVPLLHPSRNVTYGGSSYVSSKAGSAHDRSAIMKSMEEHPKQYGYGIGGLPNSLHDHMRQIAAGMIRNANSGQGWGQAFTGRSPDELGLQIASYMLDRLSGSQIKYGDLNSSQFIDQTVYRQLQHDTNGLPGIEDPQTARFWIDRMRKLVAAGKEPKIVQGETDFSPQAWENRPDEMPEEIHNAFLVSGAWYRAREGRRAISQAERDSQERQFAVMKGKEGTEKSVEGDIADKHSMDYDPTADRMAKATTSQANTMRNRLGVNADAGIEGGEEVELGGDNDIVATPIRNSRNLDNDGKYLSAYRRVAENLGSVRDPKELVQAIRQVPSNTTNSSIKGRLDAVGDTFLQMLQSQATAVMRQKISQETIAPLVDLMKGVGLPLQRAYKQTNDNMDVDVILEKILGKLYIPITTRAEKAYEAERAAFMQPTSQPQQMTQQPERPAAQMVQQQPQQPTGGSNFKDTPPQKTGLSDMMARRRARKGQNESVFSFRTRYLRKLAEMVGTGVIGTGEDFEGGNWWGAIGDLMGKPISGEVDDVKTNPDGTKGKKNGKSAKNKKSNK